ncbi:MAG: glycosyltransferase [Candidatus Magasanikbacteria bacterium]|jgi:glycosyltransferase involved in cell wall biosynthesis|nr:glycosyltransferase [Candidatus Magasanikbacteria bacterium]MBT4071554.1 glycosyltransferase [Candidatus Magasanikbacteria bacterium]
MKVSIIVTAYNYGQFIERCLRSLLDQNFDSKKYEVIVVDDASQDNTLDILQKYIDKYDNLRVIANKENVGVAESSNRGIRESLGQFVVRVDADDYVNGNFILFLSAYLEANNALLGVACDYVKVSNDESSVERFYATEEPISCGIMYRKDLLVEGGLYNSDFRHCEEKELRARLGNKYHIDNLKIPLYRYRIHGENKTTNVEELKEFDKKIKELYS